MKKYIPFITITILLIAISSGATYLLMQDKDKKDNIENNISTNKDNEQNKDKEQIKLSEQELEEYLSYVPFRVDDEKQYNAYFTNVTVNDFSDKKIIENALAIAMNKEMENNTTDNIILPKKNIQDILKKGYNKEINNFVESQAYYKINYDQFTYQENNFKYDFSYGGDPLVKIGVVKNYEAKENTLIIEEYGAAFNDLSSELSNFKTDEIITTLDTIDLDYDETILSAKEYIRNNPSKFTKYKHTFKKNNEGYYWYSTEVI